MQEERDTSVSPCLFLLLLFACKFLSANFDVILCVAVVCCLVLLEYVPVSLYMITFQGREPHWIILYKWETPFIVG